MEIIFLNILNFTALGLMALFWVYGMGEEVERYGPSVLLFLLGLNWGVALA